MSATAMGMALSITGISPRAKLVLLALCNSAAEDTFEGFPSRRHLALAADCSKDTVDRCLRELEDVLLITTTRDRMRDDGGGSTSNLYRVFPQHDPSGKSAAPPSKQGRKSAQGVDAETGSPGPHPDAAPLAAYSAAPKEPSVKGSHIVSSPFVATKAMIEGLIERAGEGCDPTAAGVHHGSDLNRLVRGGCDWEDDICPAVDKLAASFRRRGQRFGTWSLLEEHALQNRDRRLAGVADPKPAAEQPRRTGQESMASTIRRVAAENNL